RQLPDASLPRVARAGRLRAFRDGGDGRSGDSARAGRDVVPDPCGPRSLDHVPRHLRDGHQGARAIDRGSFRLAHHGDRRRRAGCRAGLAGGSLRVAEQLLAYGRLRDICSVVRAVGLEADRSPAARGARAGTKVSTDFVIGDWGGTRLRLWRLSGGEVTGRREGPGVLAVSDHAEVLAKALGDWRAKRIVLCGMAGA